VYHYFSLRPFCESSFFLQSKICPLFFLLIRPFFSFLKNSPSFPPSPVTSFDFVYITYSSLIQVLFLLCSPFIVLFIFFPDLPLCCFAHCSLGGLLFSPNVPFSFLSPTQFLRRIPLSFFFLFVLGRHVHV